MARAAAVSTDCSTHDQVAKRVPRRARLFANWWSSPAVEPALQRAVQCAQASAAIRRHPRQSGTPSGTRPKRDRVVPRHPQHNALILKTNLEQR